VTSDQAGFSPAKYWVALVGICLVIVLFQGWRMSDLPYPTYFKMIMSSDMSSIPPMKGYLFEGILGDLIGLAYVGAGFEPLTTQWLWWISGLALLAVVFTFSVKDGSLSLTDAILLVAFTRMIDSLSMWIGKFDPFLVSFLILSANKHKALALTGIVLASFMHPLVAIISTVGVFLVGAAFTGSLFWRAIPVVLAAALLDLGLFFYFFPTLLDRTGFVFVFKSELLRSAAHWGLATLVASLLVPLLSILLFKGRPQFQSNFYTILLGLWFALVAVISCIGVLDHTRVAFLLTLAPFVVLLRALPDREMGMAAFPLMKIFLALFLARLTIPHIDLAGLQLFSWPLF
jgi:hypothetical protein